MTEIHFQGDPHKDDPMYRIENAIAVKSATSMVRSFKQGCSTSFSNAPRSEIDFSVQQRRGI